MKLTEITNKIKCDVGGCGRDAAYRVDSERTGAHTGVYLCRECARELSQTLYRASKGDKT